MERTKQKSSAFLPSSALSCCVFLSLFMMVVFAPAHPRSEDIDSLEQLELQKMEFAKNTAGVDPSISTMLNLTLMNGNPPSESWIHL